MGSNSIQLFMVLVEGQEVRFILYSRQVVISTTGVVIISSKARVQGWQPCQHLPPVGPGCSYGRASGPWLGVFLESFYLENS